MSLIKLIPPELLLDSEFRKKIGLLTIYYPRPQHIITQFDIIEYLNTLKNKDKDLESFDILNSQQIEKEKEKEEDKEKEEEKEEDKEKNIIDNDKVCSVSGIPYQSFINVGNYLYEKAMKTYNNGINKSKIIDNYFK